MSLEMDKELALTTIAKLMEENNIKIEDLPSVSSTLNEKNRIISNCRTDFSTLINIAKLMYEHMVGVEGNNDAYEWAQDNIDSSWRTELDIYKPRKYKIAEVTIKINVAVPDSWKEDSDIIDYALNEDLHCNTDISVDIEDDDILEEDVERFDVYNRYIDDFSEYDFED